MSKTTRCGLFQCFLLIALLLPGMNAVAQQSALPCNPSEGTPWTNPAFNLSQSTTINRATWTGAANAIDASTANNASVAINAFSVINGFGSATLRVSDNVAANVYSIGSFVGFVVNGTNDISISTYLNGTLQETVAAANLLNTASVTVPGATERGFYATKTFNQVEISIAGAVLATTYNVYYASIRGYCAGPALACNRTTGLNYPVYPVTIDNANTGVSGVSVASVSDPEFATDASTTNYATISNVLSLAGSAFLAVKDRATVYPSGTFAGFDIENVSVLGVGVLNYVTITTYLNGVQRETQTGSSGLASVPLLSGSGHQTLGFVTAQSFDEVKITIAQPVGLSLGSTRIYSIVLQRYCTGPALVANTPTNMTMPVFPVFVDNANTGITGAVNSGTITDLSSVVDSNADNFAQISFTAGVLATGDIAVKDQLTDYPAGTFAGFDIQNSGLLSLDLLNNITITTYLNGVQREVKAGNAGLLSAQLLSGTGRQRAGFVTTLSFDEVKISLVQSVNVTLGVTNVYNAVFETFAAGPALACNTPTSLTAPTFPVYIENTNTGFTGAVGVNNNIVNPGNIIDASPATFGQITITAGLIASGSVAVKDEITDYPAGSYAGYDIENPTLLGAGLVSGVTITTYLNGVQRETIAGNGLLIGAPTSLLTGVNRQVVGFVTSLSFDEVKLTVNQNGANLGTTNVYGAIFATYCAGTIGCNSTYWLTNPGYPAVIDAERTGVTGAACVACAVNSPGNVITGDTSDFAEIITTAGVIASGSIAVKDVKTTYPAGIIAGFAVRDMNGLLQVSLLNTITISTYLNGVLQESNTGGNLLNLRLLIPILGQAPGNYNLGFATTKPFNEVQLSAQPLAGVVPVLHVYGAFVDTRLLGANAGFCPLAPLAAEDHSATPAGVALSSSLGINDRDPQGSVLSCATTPVVAPVHGSVTIQSNGSYTYTPAPGYTGQDSFQYSTCNALSRCSTAWAYISIVPARNPASPNNGPLAQPDHSETLAGVPVSGSARNNDIDPDGNTLTYSIVTNPGHGGFTLNPDGTYTYTPEAGFIGNDTAKVQVCDNGTPSLCSTSLIIATVVPDQNGTGNDAPYAQDDVAATPAGVKATGNVLGNDSDPNGDGLTASLAGTVPPSAGSLILNPNGAYTFYPAPGFSGTLSVPYRVCDGAATPLCDTAMLSIAVQGRPPVAEPDHTATQLNTAVAGSLRTNDTDPQNSPLTYNTTPAVAPVNGNVTIDASGNYTYTPANGFIGQDSFAYTVCNGIGTCSQAWTYIDVMQSRIALGANTPPAPLHDNSETLTGVAVSGNASSNDLDADGNTLTYTVTTQPAHGTLALNANGAYTYTPAAGYNGMDTATIQVCDNGSPSLCAASLITITVSPDQNDAANDPPKAQNDVRITPLGVPVTGNVLGNDSDPNGDVLSASMIGTVPSSSGVLLLNANGSYTFYPATGYIGTVTIPYKVCDGSGSCDTATLTVVVQKTIGPDLAPIISSRGTMNMGQSRDAAITIYNGGSTPTTGAIQFAIMKMEPQFSIICLPNTASVTIVGSVAVKNNNWIITDMGTYYQFTLKATDPDNGNPLSIPPGGFLKVGVTITATGTSRSMGYMNISIFGNTGGGESPATNNDAAFLYSIN